MDIHCDADEDACDGIDNNFFPLSIHTPSTPQSHQPINISSNLPLDLQEALTKLSSSNYEDEFIGLRMIRQLLSVVDCARMEEVINTEIAPILMSMVHSRPYEFTLEVCWVLCNLGSGNSECTKYLINIHSLEFFDQIFDLNPSSFDLQDLII